MTNRPLPPQPALARWQRVLLAVFAVGALGTATELWLLGHYEDVWQYTPLVALGLGLGAALWLLLRPSKNAMNVVRLAAVLFVGAGLVGIYQHLNGNVEFERELKPGLAGWPLLWEALRGATPALAPGAIAQLGLVAWVATLGHPLPHPASSTHRSISPKELSQ